MKQYFIRYRYLSGETRVQVLVGENDEHAIKFVTERHQDIGAPYTLLKLYGDKECKQVVHNFLKIQDRNDNQVEVGDRVSFYGYGSNYERFGKVIDIDYDFENEKGEVVAFIWEEGGSSAKHPWRRYGNNIKKV